MPKISSKKTLKKKSIIPKRKARKKKLEQKPSIRKEEKRKEEKYIEAIGRRKTATARVRIFPEVKEKIFLVNKREANIYFTDFELQKIIFSPLQKTGSQDKFKIEIQVQGGGKRGQAEAIRLGLARALIQLDKALKGVLKLAGYLTRDPREVERKKFGLKGARRAPQWQKR